MDVINNIAKAKIKLKFNKIKSIKIFNKKKINKIIQILTKKIHNTINKINLKLCKFKKVYNYVINAPNGIMEMD